MADLAWAAGVVEKVAEALRRSDGVLADYPKFATAALSASPLSEAVALIERLVIQRVASDLGAVDQTAADAAAFVARVREG